MVCKIKDCTSKVMVKNKSLCKLHYHRLRENGDANYQPKTPEDRFWAKVKKTNKCWLWTGTAAGRYGQFSNKGRTPSHRYSWELHNGRIPEGMNVLHRCDVPLCVNPSHLFLGTHSDNMQDMVNKGRHPATNGDTKTKLDQNKVSYIRKSNLSTSELAKKFKVSEATVYCARTYRTWRNV